MLSNALPIANNLASECGGPSNSIPTGKPDRVRPAGTVSPGKPAVAVGPVLRTPELGALPPWAGSVGTGNGISGVVGMTAAANRWVAKYPAYRLGQRVLPLASLLVAFGIAACAIHPPDRAPGERAADAALAREVRLALNADPELYARHVDISVEVMIPDI